MMMTISSSSSSSICCCLNNNSSSNNSFIVPSSQPQLHPSSSKPANNRISAHCWQRNKKADALQDHRRGSASTWWRNHHSCALGIASMVIILTNGSSSSSEIMRTNPPADFSMFNHHLHILSEPTAAVGAPISNRWSDTRTCPPWRSNSLETIIPENLPRPSAHRRSESVTTTTTRTDTDDRQAGAVLVKAANPNCFSM